MLPSNVRALPASELIKLRRLLCQPVGAIQVGGTDAGELQENEVQLYGEVVNSIQQATVSEGGRGYNLELVIRPTNVDSVTGLNLDALKRAEARLRELGLREEAEAAYIAWQIVAGETREPLEVDSGPAVRALVLQKLQTTSTDYRCDNPRVAAIKAWRNATGGTLKGGMAYVDALVAELAQQSKSDS